MWLNLKAHTFPISASGHIKIARRHYSILHPQNTNTKTPKSHREHFSWVNGMSLFCVFRQIKKWASEIRPYATILTSFLHLWEHSPKTWLSHDKNTWDQIERKQEQKKIHRKKKFFFFFLWKPHISIPTAPYRIYHLMSTCWPRLVFRSLIFAQTYTHNSIFSVYLYVYARRASTKAVIS